jgi:hypothetical protein
MNRYKKHLSFAVLLGVAVFIFLAVKSSHTNWDKLGVAYASGEPLTITAPTTLNNAAGVTAVKFVDTTGSAAYYLDPGGSTSMVLAGSASIEGNTTIGNASGDTLTANAAAWTFANDTNFVLSGGANGLSFDTSTFSVDATSHRVGIGMTNPTNTLDVTGAFGVTGNAVIGGSISVGGNTLLPALDTGEYTPTLTNVTNVASSTAAQVNYIQVGRMIIVSGSVTIDPTATGAVELGMSLPVASNFTNFIELGGSMGNAVTAANIGTVQADPANDRARFLINTSDAASRSYLFIFMYSVSTL